VTVLWQHRWTVLSLLAIVLLLLASSVAGAVR